MRNGSPYIIGFAVAVCLVCSVFVSGAAVSLKDRQIQNQILDQQVKVLNVAGILPEGQKATAEEVEKKFAEHVKPFVVNLATGEFENVQDIATFDQQKLKGDPATSTKLAQNAAGILWLPKQAKIYQVSSEKGEMLVLPIEGKGLWSTLYGFLALEKDGQTIAGITFYQHGETPGLGGEVDNSRWKALWPGRKAFGENGQPKIEVRKGQAGPVAEDPYGVDGLSGATITSRGVTFLIQFWLGEQGFGPFLKKFRSGEVKS